LLLLLAAPLAAQQTARASGWRVRYDRPSATDSAMKVAAMGPGWHVTTSSSGSGVAWRAEQTAQGNFRVALETSLSPSAGNHLEGYGLFLGGRDLDSANQSYLYFLIRKDGQFLIKHRAGAETHNIAAWTPSPAIVKQEGSANADNTLAVEASADSARFFVNGQRVYAMARAAAPVDGIAGLRVNHGLSVHVARLTVTPR
jgi:hypothetical protein